MKPRIHLVAENGHLVPIANIAPDATLTGPATLSVNGQPVGAIVSMQLKMDDPIADIDQLPGIDTFGFAIGRTGITAYRRGKEVDPQRALVALADAISAHLDRRECEEASFPGGLL